MSDGLESWHTTTPHHSHIRNTRMQTGMYMVVCKETHHSRHVCTQMPNTKSHSNTITPTCTCMPSTDVKDRHVHIQLYTHTRALQVLSLQILYTQLCTRCSGVPLRSPAPLSTEASTCPGKVTQQDEARGSLGGGVDAQVQKVGPIASIQDNSLGLLPSSSQVLIRVLPKTAISLCRTLPFFKDLQSSVLGETSTFLPAA